MRLSISAVVAVVLLVLLVTATPAQFPGLVGAQSIEENAGGGDDVNPDFGAVNATVAADNGPGTADGPLRQVQPYEIGDIVVEGTTFASAINYNDVRIPVPDGTTPGDFTVMVGQLFYAHAL